MDLKPLITLLAIVNPLAIVPFFIHYTQGFSQEQRLRTIRTASFSAFCVIAACALLGLQILDFFSISLQSFQVGGGMLLLISAMNMLNAQPAEAKANTHDLEEGVEKAAQRPDLEWHFIGPIQSNKTRGIAEHFTWVHTIDRLKIAERLSAQRPTELPPMQVCVQVNISDEASKSGCRPDDALALCQAIAAQPNLKLRGLMAIPEATDDRTTQRRYFAALRQLMAEINAANPSLKLDTLSMGMSGDLEAAVAEGATIVRVGSAIFGQRSYATNTNNPASTEH